MRLEVSCETNCDADAGSQNEQTIIGFSISTQRLISHGRGLYVQTRVRSPFQWLIRLNSTWRRII
ncbi:hypothetical protein O6H91_11G065200 [Diphasiastrum complanatum]|uniref:Uncharacterized protein n=1 Tax=Diphasiastrum complanatum TaxID=34168 RepID=A0ACC2CA00_DIPCM|nr:hypothetical protein O6H91_11G065200 [Diphasiastrum complanatum]